MVDVRSKALKEVVNIDRIIGEYTHGKEGPLFVVTAGIHGNEPSGIFALKKIFNCLKYEEVPIRGTFVGMAGNLAALSSCSRYMREDLNRIFKAEKLKEIYAGAGEINCHVEENEAAAMIKELDRLEKREYTVKYFLDCHTTSSESQPFACVFRGQKNYEFADNFPVHNIHGLGSELKGTWSKFLIDRGYTGFTFEAGQHDDLSSIENQEAAIWLALVETGCINIHDLPIYRHHYEVLGKSVIEGKKIFDVINHYVIDPDEEFEMEPGFVNFQLVEKGMLLARNKYGNILCPADGRILMPLYQKLGEDGFFIISERKDLEEEFHVPQKAINQIK